MAKLSARLTLAGAGIIALTGAGPDNFDVRTQIGPNPVLPEPQQFLLPPMHLASVAGWKSGETPEVASGLRVQALATGLEHPRFCLHAAKRRCLGGGIEKPGHGIHHPSEKRCHELA